MKTGSPKIKKYLNWFLMNFVVCLLPVGVSWILVNALTENIFLGFVSYSFTLLVSSIYIFDKWKPVDSSLMYLSIFYIVACMIFYCIYPIIVADQDNHLGNMILNYHEWVLAGLLFFTVGLSFFLNKAAIEEAVNDSEASRSFESAEAQKNHVKAIGQTLKAGK